jgi:hypothetical protein
VHGLEQAFAAPPPGLILESLLNVLHVADLLERSLFAVVCSAIRLLTLPTEKSAESHATIV